MEIFEGLDGEGKEKPAIGVDENGLLPCPFCGEDGELRYQLHDIEDWLTQCNNCGAASCPYGMRVSKSEAIGDWNKRALQPKGKGDGV